MTSNPPKKKLSLFAKIETRDDAFRTTKEGSISFIVIGLLHVAVGFWLLPAVIADGIAYTLLGLIVLRWRSRIAAGLLALIAIPNVVLTLMNLVGATEMGGRNIWLATVVAIVAVRLVEATFKLKGRFRNSQERPNQPPKPTAMAGTPPTPEPR